MTVTPKHLKTVPSNTFGIFQVLATISLQKVGTRPHHLSQCLLGDHRNVMEVSRVSGGHLWGQGHHLLQITARKRQLQRQLLQHQEGYG